jgi:hypothetical protein
MWFPGWSRRSTGISWPVSTVPDLGLWLPSGRDLATIAGNIGIKQVPEPEAVLGQIAGLLAEQGTREATAGLLYKLIALTRPYGEMSGLFALEAARVVLIANGFPAARISRERAEALWLDVEAGRAATAADIGRRLTEL